MNERGLRAMLLDRNWMLVLPANTTSEQFETHSYINSALITMFNENDHPVCHSALLDSNGLINPCFFLWDPTPGMIEKLIRVDPLIYLTPQKLVIRGRPIVHPDPSTLELELVDHRQVDLIGISDKADVAISHPHNEGLTPKLSYFRDGRYRNCFFLIPKPFPKISYIRDRVETLANIRNISEDDWELVSKEAKNKRFTARTERVRKLMIDVVTELCPYSAQFGFQYLDAEGKRV